MKRRILFVPDSCLGLYSRQWVFLCAMLFTAGARGDTKTGFDNDANGHRQLHVGKGASAAIPGRLAERALFEGDSEGPVHAEKRLGATIRQRGAEPGAIEYRDGRRSLG